MYFGLDKSSMLYSRTLFTIWVIAEIAAMIAAPTIGAEALMPSLPKANKIPVAKGLKPDVAARVVNRDVKPKDEAMLTIAGASAIVTAASPAMLQRMLKTASKGCIFAASLTDATGDVIVLTKKYPSPVPRARILMPKYSTVPKKDVLSFKLFSKKRMVWCNKASGNSVKSFTIFFKGVKINPQKKTYNKISKTCVLLTGGNPKK